MNRSESDLARARLEGDRRTHCLTRRGWKEVSFSRLWPTALLLLPVLGTRAIRNPRSTLQLVQPAKVESCAPSVSEEGEQRVVGAPRQLGGLPPPSHATRGLTAYKDLRLLLCAFLATAPTSYVPLHPSRNATNDLAPPTPPSALSSNDPHHPSPPPRNRRKYPRPRLPRPSTPLALARTWLRGSTVALTRLPLLERPSAEEANAHDQRTRGDLDGDCSRVPEESKAGELRAGAQGQLQGEDDGGGDHAASGLPGQQA